MPRIALALALAALTLACGETTDDPPVTLDAAVTPDAAPEPEPTPDAAPEPEPDAAPDPTAERPYTATLDLPATPPAYDLPLPAYFSVETLLFNAQRPVVDDDNTPRDNPITDAGATLGRVLFYDTNLSHNRTVACASCHQAEHGFSDDRVLSLGFDGGHTERHSMGLTNARFYRPGGFFWDQRAGTLEEQVLMPFQDAIEMGMTLDGLITRIGNGDYYPPLFEAAFGDPAITPDRVARALAQFVRSLVSTTSQYDLGRAQVESRGDPFPNFTEDENFGKFLFSMPPPAGGFGCFFCHRGEAFIAQTTTSNGLDADSSEDQGYGAIVGTASFQGTFKVPSLKNVEIRAPYMHDGRFATLEEVIDHYSDGVQPHPNIGLPFGVIDGAVPQLQMTVREKRALRAFLRTLTDHAMITDPRFADPFVRE